MSKDKDKNFINHDFSAGARWIFYSVLIVIAPVFVPYIYTFLQGKTINIEKDALDISLLVYSVSCGLLYLCFESNIIKKWFRKLNKVLSGIFFAFSIIFYIHIESSETIPDNINTFIKIGLFFIVYATIMGYIISNKEDRMVDNNEK